MKLVCWIGRRRREGSPYAQGNHSSGWGVSRRSFLKLSVALGGGAATIATSAPETAHAAENEVAYPEKFTFAVMSYVQLFSPDLWSDCPDYTTAENSDRKMFRESSDILDKAKPDMALVPGDLTKDGERVCHEWARDRFAAARQQLAAVGVDTQFYVINGSHDLNNHHGKDFSGGSSTDAERTDPLTYKSHWAECGYADTVAYDVDGTADGSLSYVARPCPGLTLIAVAGCVTRLVRRVPLVTWSWRSSTMASSRALATSPSSLASTSWGCSCSRCSRSTRPWASRAS